MSIHIIIDGYNLIRQSNTLGLIDNQDIELGREALLEMLIAYRKIKPHMITVVFDGANAPPFSRRKTRVQGITIKFSRFGHNEFCEGSDIYNIYNFKSRILKQSFPLA